MRISSERPPKVFSFILTLFIFAIFKIRMNAANACTIGNFVLDAYASPFFIIVKLTGVTRYFRRLWLTKGLL